MASEPASKASDQSRKQEFADDDVAAVPSNNSALLLVGVMLASLLQVLDTTIANVAIPHMQSALGATTDTVTWVLTSYIITSAVAMPTSGWLADRIGSRQLLIVSVGGFIVFSMLCGIATSLEEMVIFRALQGVAGAFVMPVGQSVMLNSTPRKKHPQVLAMWGLGVMIGPIAGPVLGGYLTENWNWRWVFYVNVPVGIISLALLIATLPNQKLSPRKFDLFGFSFLSMALIGLQLFLDRGNQEDWFASHEIWIYTIVMISCFWIFLVHLTTTKNPIFKLELFKDRNLPISLIFMFVVGLVLYATMALLPPLFQQLLGYDVIETGIILTPRGVGVLVSMQVAGFMTRKGFDPRILVGMGMALSVWPLWQMAHWSLAVDTYHIVFAGLVQGLGLGLVFLPLNTIAFATLRPELRTDASSLMNLLRSIGSSVGISIVTVLLARNTQISHSDIANNITQNSIAAIDLSSIGRTPLIGDVAMTALNGEVSRQAVMVAYLDNFYLMVWMTLLAVPLTFFLKTAPKAKAK